MTVAGGGKDGGVVAGLPGRIRPILGVSARCAAWRDRRSWCGGLAASAGVTSDFGARLARGVASRGGTFRVLAAVGCDFAVGVRRFGSGCGCAKAAGGLVNRVGSDCAEVRLLSRIRRLSRRLNTTGADPVTGSKSRRNSGVAGGGGGISDTCTVGGIADSGTAEGGLGSSVSPEISVIAAKISASEGCNSWPIILPSRKNSTRSAQAAAPASCVTIQIV